MIPKPTINWVLFLAATLLSLAGCTPKKKYTLAVTTSDSETSKRATEKETIEAKDDTTAYKMAYHKFWIGKLSATELNNKYSNVSSWPMPVSFTLTNSEGMEITYSEAESARLVSEMSDYFEKRIAEITNAQANGDIKIDTSDQKNALAGISFFISEKQFNKKRDSLMKATRFKKWENSSIYDNKIGEYEFERVDGYFAGDSLYKISILGEYISYDDYNRKMDEQFSNLKSLLQNKYGSPEKVTGLPSWTSIDEGYYKVCGVWRIGNKQIEMRMSGHGTYYTLDLVVFKPVIQNRLEHEQEMKVKKSTEEAASKL